MLHSHKGAPRKQKQGLENETSSFIRVADRAERIKNPPKQQHSSFGHIIPFSALKRNCIPSTECIGHHFQITVALLCYLIWTAGVKWLGGSSKVETRVCKGIHGKDISLGGLKDKQLSHAEP